MRQWLSAARMRRFAVGSVLRCVSSVYTCASLLPHSSGSGSVPTNVHADRVVRNDEKKKYQFGSPGTEYASCLLSLAAVSQDAEEPGGDLVYLLLQSLTIPLQ
jgi:hypothetical protein